MPRDYRGDRPHKTRRKPRQTRKPVTITHLALTVEPEPEPKKLYTAEHRAAYYLQGISHPAHGKMLYEAGIEPHHVVQWTKTGIGIEDYTRMAAIAAVGVTPTAFKDLKMQGLSDRTIIYCFNHNVDTQLIVNWEQARHSSTCTRTSIASCACVILPVETICYLIDRQKTISWLRYAIRLGANAKLINFLAQREIPPAIINTFFSAHQVGTGSNRFSPTCSSVDKRWRQWLEKAQGDAVFAEVIAANGGKITDIAKWLRTGLGPERCGLFLAAGYTTKEAAHPDMQHVTNDAIAMMADLFAPLNDLMQLSSV